MTTRRRRSHQTPPSDGGNITDYRYSETRKNNPPAGLASQGRIAELPKQRYSFDPHLPLVLRFDGNGQADRLPELLETARRRALSSDEVQMLADALRNHQPWLEWAGKREKRWFEVDPVALHIHERVSAHAIMRIAARQNVWRGLWGDPEQEYHEAVRFYQYDVEWTNRLILGDSLVVMNSLAKREDLAGKVQMIYMDPPYGIRFPSNFQSLIGNRDVKDREQDLTREPEMVKAYRDTWTLGVHSYLAYLRDRFYAAKELLADTGSIFVQIGDENLHSVRDVMDEVFGRENFCGLITFSKTGWQSTSRLASVTDYLLWYCRESKQLKYRQLYAMKTPGEIGATGYTLVELPDGSWRSMVKAEQDGSSPLPQGSLIFDGTPLISSGATPEGIRPFSFGGQTYHPAANSHWKTTIHGLERAAKANRLVAIGNRIEFKHYLLDFPSTALTNVWMGLGERGFTGQKLYVVQTAAEVIQRCMLMTTDPGDFVLDPTCGSGTTAYVAEQWGRRWITIDTSRVAVALARQRLLTSSFPYFKTQDASNKLHPKSFFYKTVPHITLRSIAQNVALDPIFAKWSPVLKERLEMLNLALGEVTDQVRSRLLSKLAEKERRDGRRAVAEADRRRWRLPKDKWEEWEIPFDTDPDWPDLLQEALQDYRQAWREKVHEVNSCIAASADQEELVDQPEIDRGVVRVSGPFTVEAVQPAEESPDMESPIAGEPEQLDTFEDNSVNLDAPINAEAYLDRMIRLLKNDGVRFPGNKVMRFTSLDRLSGNVNVLHGEGAWLSEDNGQSSRRVAVSFGPQYGSVTAMQVEDCLWAASRRGYDDLVFAGFSFDGAAQAAIQSDSNPRVHLHMAHVCPDVNMGDLLKEPTDSQLFTVFGLPRTELSQGDDGQWTIEMQGVDIYSPVENTILSTGADKVAAWFLDSDYDGRTFCVTQAFFPDAGAWRNLARSLKGVIDEDAFSAFSGTTSLPFPSGQHMRVAVKVIDPRGNEAMRVHNLEGARYGEA